MTGLRALVEKNRSYRRFDESKPLTRDDLLSLVELARITPSARNMQPLKYVLCADRVTNEAVFACLAWAGYLPDWPGPASGERPTGYIVICIDTKLTDDWWCDDGIAAQTMLLGAVERGRGGCMVGAINQPKLRKVLDLPDHLKIRLVLALGTPAEEVVLEEVESGGDIRYYRDDADVHHVPKRSMDEIILK